MTNESQVLFVILTAVALWLARSKAYNGEFVEFLMMTDRLGATLIPTHAGRPVPSRHR